MTMRSTAHGAAALMVALIIASDAVVPHALQQPTGPCVCCSWRPPPTKSETRVRTVTELEAAVRSARPYSGILIEPGTYRLRGSLDISAPGVVLRGISGDRSAVTLRGDGMSESQVRIAISISAPGVTVADLTVGNVGQHGVHIRGDVGASGVTLHNIHVVDTGQQLIKGSLGLKTPPYADGGLVACSLIEYTDHAPSDYTNGIDVIGGRGWTVRDNDIRRVRGPASMGWRAGPAILFWGNSIDTRVERNRVTDSYRGIAFGIGPGGTEYRRDREYRYDHQGGVIQNNTVCNDAPWADEGIELSAARAARVEGNRVMVAGRLPWSISVRFPASSAVVQNNVISRRVVLRDGGQAEMSGNVVTGVRPFRRPCAVPTA